QRIGRISEDQFRNDERRIERGANGERPAETIRRMAVAGVTMGMIMRVGMGVVVVIVRHADDRRPSDCFDGDLYSARRFEYYYSDTATNSSTSGPPPTENTMNCLPPAM